MSDYISQFDQLQDLVGVRPIRTCALIGSRKAPSEILVLASTIGRVLSENRVIAHSGGAYGMDNAFMKYYSPDYRKIFIPNWKFYDHRHNGHDIIAWQTLEQKNLAIDELEHVYSDPRSIPLYMQNLFSRNVAQVLGETLDQPVDCVIYWAQEVNGIVSGGTRIAVYIARRHGIPCFNLYHQENRSAIENILGGSGLGIFGI